MTLAILMSTQSPAHSQDIDLMTGCFYEVDVDGKSSIFCEEDRNLERLRILDLINSKTLLDENTRQEILLAWYREYLAFPNEIEMLVSAVVESGELPDSFYYSAQKIINDPNFDTLHFQLL
jgi:hypothetical protein